MTGAKRKGNAIGEAFVPLTHSLIRNPRYKQLGLNARRFLDFLYDEHLSHGGKHNGRLQATYRQLRAFGLTHRLIAPAIREACRSGLVRIARPGGRNLPTRYELTWLPRHDALGPGARHQPETAKPSNELN